MSTIQVNAIQSSTGTQEVTQTTIFSGTAKAWSNLNGTGTIAERDSFNLSTYTDVGTGNYTFTIDNDFAANDYSPSGIARVSIANKTNLGLDNATDLSVGEFGVFSSYNGTTIADAAIVSVQAFGDLA